jgi:hypothetical protein
MAGENGGSSHLYRLGRCLTAGMLHQLNFEDFMLGYSNLHDGADFGRAAGDAKQEFRGSVFSVNPQAVSLFDVLHSS